MKKLLVLLACSVSTWALAQNSVNITPQQYNTLKQTHQLDLSKDYRFIGTPGNQQPVKPSAAVLAARETRSVCSCLIPLDSTFSVVPFNSVDSSSTPADYRNDDGYTDKIGLPFSFNFYGVNYDSLFINNNGNISFLAPYYNYTPDSFPTSLFNMIAPFWGDVDTRDTTSGLVYYKITSTAMIVKWENVGYYNEHMDKTNTFQLIITDGTDPLLPAGTNVSFCYGDMGWTTGDASNGVNGFGGYAATVGANEGNGSDYFQVGRMDHAGTDFDGPYNMVDGVDFLDNQEIYFNLAVSGNIPPVIVSSTICDTIDVYTGDTVRSFTNDSVMFTVAVTTPEIDQTVTAVLSSTAPANHFSYTTLVNTPTYKLYECKFMVGNLPTGVYSVNVVATDNGTPVRQETQNIPIKVNPHLAAGISEKQIQSLMVYPNPTEGNITVKHNFNPGSNPTLSIINVVGSTVASVNLTSQEQNVDISNLPKGVYFAIVSGSEGKSKTFKIVHK